LETLIWLLNILKVALGLGFVIFIHELGHFLLAKWNGVKVEKFSIGFGPTLLGFRRGETEYVLAAIPLGGFVKMLGEGPEDEANKSTDPRAYPNKSVGARMAIISAGVIMNILLGLVCFVYAYGHGMDEIPAKIGAVGAGSPAYKAGLRAGDEVVTIDGRGDISFPTLQVRVLLSGPGQVLHFGVQRPGHSGLIAMDIQPVREPKKEYPTIGIGKSEGLKIGAFLAPAGMADPPDYPGLEGRKLKAFVDTLVEAGPTDQPPTSLQSIDEYYRLLARYADRPIKHVIERRPATSSEDDPPSKRLELTLPPAQFVDFGLQMAAEPVRAVQPGSPAERAGFRPGDRIVKVNGQDDFDPMRLPYRCFEQAGKPMTFEVERAAANGVRTTQTLTVTPDDSPPQIEPNMENEDLDVPGLGLCLPITPHVVGVRPGSPAERAGLKPGDVINSLTLKPPKPQEPALDKAKGRSGRSTSAPERSTTFNFDDQSASWATAFAIMQDWPLQEVDLVVNKASEPYHVTPEPDRTWSYPLRGLRFLLLVRKLPPQPIAAALRRGFDDTIDKILEIYATFRSLATRRVSTSSMGGVIMISTVAYDTARQGLIHLIQFLGFLSINLAVLNFLPIPPLDGGQMVFLLAEKVRGRPLPDVAVIAGTYLGLVLVLGLVVFVTYQDIYRLVTGYFF
jgi:regulator of sigma E protease